jgi:hypothetical protein
MSAIRDSQIFLFYSSVIHLCKPCPNLMPMSIALFHTNPIQLNFKNCSQNTFNKQIAEKVTMQTNPV